VTNFSTEITRWKNNARAALTLTFDGCYAGTWESALDILRQYGMSSTWFLATESVGEALQGRTVVTWEKLAARSHLVEVGSHTVTHPKLKPPFIKTARNYVSSPIGKIKKIFTFGLIPSMKKVGLNIYRDSQGVGYRDLLIEAKKSKSEIERRLSPENVTSFAYPGGRYNSRLKKGLAGLGFISARSTRRGLNFPDSLDFFALKSETWNVNVDAEQANKWIDNAIEQGAWLIETYHVISKDQTSGYHYDTSISDIDSHLQYATTRNLWIDTQHNIVKYIREKNVTEIITREVSGTRMVLLLKNNLDSTIYRQSLTLEVVVPDSWNRVRIKQARNVQDVRPIRRDEKNIIYHNTYPNRGEISIFPY
jgi:hypothetical protein